MKRIAAVFFLGAFFALPGEIGSAQSLGDSLRKQSGKPPVITHSFASEQLHHGDTWRIYVAAEDPDGDMRRFVGVLEQVGYGTYPSSYASIKKKNRQELRGYLVFRSTSGTGLRVSEWTQLKLTLSIRDRGGNTSNRVVFPLVLSRGAKQPPPPPPFDSSGLDRLGVLWFELRHDGYRRGPFGR